MIPGDVSRIIKLDFHSGLTYRDGDSVIVSVIKRLTANKWAIGIKGRVIPAYSKVDLIPGQKLRATIIQHGQQYQLKINSSTQDTFAELLTQQGLSVDQLSHTILASLIRSNLPLLPEVMVKIRYVMEKLKKKSPRYARLLAILLEKNIDISSNKIEALLELMEYGNNTGKDHRKGNKKHPQKQKNEIEQTLKKLVNKTSNVDENALQVYNHIKGKNPGWIIIPFLIDGERALKGTIRLLYNTLTEKVEKMTLIVHQPENIRIFFHIVELKNHRKCMIYCNDEKKREILMKEIKNLRINLQNREVKIDDTIYKEEDFDGFTPMEEASLYRKINIRT